MHPTIGKILPSDGYTIKRKGSLTEEHYQALYQLYQPIIGVIATTLYLTLHHSFKQNKELSHHQLMQVLNQPLDKIYQAREKCEAIGLINTYQLDKDNYTVYHYELNTPLSAKAFLNDDLLNQLLYHQLGKKRHEEIKAILCEVKVSSEQLGKDVTTNFTNVFSINSSFKPESIQVAETANQTATPDIKDVDIDWKWLQEMLEKRMLPVNKIMTADNIKLIAQMAALYQLSTTQVEKALQWAISTDHELSREEFKIACLDLVETLPTELSVVNDRERMKSKENQQPKSKREQFIELMETVSPKELLEDLSNGNRASNQDLKMIADIMDAQGLNPGVMNVLIHYVMLKTDMKLSKSYMEKIASHWARKNVKTVHQAMTLAKSENNKYQQWDKKKSGNYYRPKSKEDIVPDWFKDEKKKTAKKVSKPIESNENNKDINEILKAFKGQ